jgi:hypothetical protein
MKPLHDTDALSRRLFHCILRETDVRATVSLFTDLCRASPAFRLWLWEEFGHEPNCRQAFVPRFEFPLGHQSSLDRFG